MHMKSFISSSTEKRKPKPEYLCEAYIIESIAHADNQIRGNIDPVSNSISGPLFQS